MISKIIKQEKNPFLEREELTIQITNPATPTYDEVKEAIGKDKELTIVKKINTNFGRKIFTAEAVVYDNTEAKKKIETIPKKTKKKIQAEEKAAAEAAKKAEAEAKKAKEEATSDEQPATSEQTTENQELKTNNQQPENGN